MFSVQRECDTMQVRDGCDGLMRLEELEKESGERHQGDHVPKLDGKNG